MAGFVLGRLNVCPRKTLFSSRTCYSAKETVLGRFASERKSLEGHTRCIYHYTSKNSCPTSQQPTCRATVPRVREFKSFHKFINVTPMFSSKININANGFRSHRMKDKEQSPDLLWFTANGGHYRRLHYSSRTLSKNNNNGSSDHFHFDKQITNGDSDVDRRLNDPELKTVVKNNTYDFEHDFNNETIENIEVEHTFKDIVVDKINLDSTSENSKIAEFEYDYQVAEDVEEYDYMDETKIAEQQVRPEKVLPISLERGKDGVFDLDELVTLLESLGAENIATFPVPPEANFCDHMVVVSAKSQRHMQALNDELLWVHKRKKSKKDPHLIIEGLKRSSWCAMDIGNIVLHIFYGDSREYYDIESLWTLGPENDPKCQEQSVDPYALSAEDLFWLETGKTSSKNMATACDDNGLVGNDKKGKITSDRAKTSMESEDWPNKFTESDAGWGTSKPS